MGLMDGLFNVMFGNGRNVLRETAEVFVRNAEAGDARDMVFSQAVLDQFAREFARPDRGAFDRVVDGLNRLPRPAMAFGTMGLFVVAMVDPIWFAERMQGIALVPEPLWWLLGAIISFYFGARHQAKGQAFQRSISETLGRAVEVERNLRLLDDLQSDLRADNAALEEWKRGK